MTDFRPKHSSVKAAELRDHRRSRQHSDRRSSDSADHQRAFRSRSWTLRGCRPRRQTASSEKHFTVDEKQHNVTLTDEGVREAEKLAGVESFYTAGNMEWPHLIDNALKAHLPVQKGRELRHQRSPNRDR